MHFWEKDIILSTRPKAASVPACTRASLRATDAVTDDRGAVTQGSAQTCGLACSSELGKYTDKYSLRLSPAVEQADYKPVREHSVPSACLAQTSRACDFTAGTFAGGAAQEHHVVVL